MRCVAEGGPGDPDTSHKFICKAMQLLVFVRFILKTRLGAHGEPCPAVDNSEPYTSRRREDVLLWWLKGPHKTQSSNVALKIVFGLHLCLKLSMNNDQSHCSCSRGTMACKHHSPPATMSRCLSSYSSEVEVRMGKTAFLCYDNDSSCIV
jgi:hypothetical protein